MVDRGDRVVVFADNGPEAVVTFWAALKADAVVSVVSPQTRTDKLAYLLTHRNMLAASRSVADYLEIAEDEVILDVLPRLRPGPLPGEKVLYTGDLCRLDEDGYLYFVARMDDIIKSRGEKVAPKEVETALYDVEGVKEVAVISTPSPPFRPTSSARTPPDVGEPRPSHPQVVLAIQILGAATTARETRVSGKP